MEAESTSGNPIERVPYVVFQIEASPKRPDYMNIPEIKDAHKKLQTEERDGKITEAMDAFAVFRRIVLTSYDLLFAHAQELMAEVERELHIVLGPATQSLQKRPHLRDLDQVNVSFN